MYVYKPSALDFSRHFFLSYVQEKAPQTDSFRLATASAEKRFYHIRMHLITGQTPPHTS